VRLAYADPPYPGCAHLYRNHPDYAGEVDHRELVERLERDYDGWVLHTSVGGYRMLERERILPEDGIRICQWFKPFAAFKRNVSVAYAYEPVIIKAARKPVVGGGEVSRDWIEEAVRENITMKRGLTGAKPDRVCKWAFQLMGALPDDELIDIYTGTGAVMVAWDSWKNDLLRAA
jgi:hypothetical protein